MVPAFFWLGNSNDDSFFLLRDFYLQPIAAAPSDCIFTRGFFGNNTLDYVFKMEEVFKKINEEKKEEILIFSHKIL